MEQDADAGENATVAPRGSKLRSAVIEPWLRLTNRRTSWASYNPCCSLGLPGEDGESRRKSMSSLVVTSTGSSRVKNSEQSTEGTSESSSVRNNEQFIGGNNLKSGYNSAKNNNLSSEGRAGSSSVKRGKLSSEGTAGSSSVKNIKISLEETGGCSSVKNTELSSEETAGVKNRKISSEITAGSSSVKNIKLSLEGKGGSSSVNNTELFSEETTKPSRFKNRKISSEITAGSSSVKNTKLSSEVTTGPSSVENSNLEGLSTAVSLADENEGTSSMDDNNIRKDPWRSRVKNENKFARSEIDKNNVTSSVGGNIPSKRVVKDGNITRSELDKRSSTNGGDISESVTDNYDSLDRIRSSKTPSASKSSGSADHDNSFINGSRLKPVTTPWISSSDQNRSRSLLDENYLKINPWKSYPTTMNSRTREDNLSLNENNSGPSKQTHRSLSKSSVASRTTEESMLGSSSLEGDQYENEVISRKSTSRNKSGVDNSWSLADGDCRRSSSVQGSWRSKSSADNGGSDLEKMEDDERWYCNTEVRSKSKGNGMSSKNSVKQDGRRSRNVNKAEERNIDFDFDSSSTLDYETERRNKQFVKRGAEDFIYTSSSSVGTLDNKVGVRRKVMSRFRETAGEEYENHSVAGLNKNAYRVVNSKKDVSVRSRDGEGVVRKNFRSFSPDGEVYENHEVSEKHRIRDDQSHLSDKVSMRDFRGRGEASVISRSPSLEGEQYENQVVSGGFTSRLDVSVSSRNIDKVEEQQKKKKKNVREEGKSNKGLNHFDEASTDYDSYKSIVDHKSTPHPSFVSRRFSYCVNDEKYENQVMGDRLKTFGSSSNITSFADSKVKGVHDNFGENVTSFAVKSKMSPVKGSRENWENSSVSSLRMPSNSKGPQDANSSNITSFGAKNKTSQVRSARDDWESSSVSSFGAKSKTSPRDAKFEKTVGEAGKNRKSVSNFDISVVDDDMDDRVYCNTEVRSRNVPSGSKQKKSGTFALVSEKEMKKRYSVYTGTSMERTTSDDFSNESNTYDNGTFAKRKTDVRMRKSHLSGSLDQLALCLKHRDEFHAINNGEKLRLRKEKRNSFSSNRRTRKISSDDYFSPKTNIVSGWQSSSTNDTDVLCDKKDKVTLAKRDPAASNQNNEPRLCTSLITPQYDEDIPEYANVIFDSFDDSVLRKESVVITTFTNKDTTKTEFDNPVYMELENFLMVQPTKKPNEKSRSVSDLTSLHAQFVMKKNLQNKSEMKTRCGSFMSLTTDTSYLVSSSVSSGHNVRLSSSEENLETQVVYEQSLDESLVETTVVKPANNRQMCEETSESVEPPSTVQESTLKTSTSFENNSKKLDDPSSADEQIQAPVLQSSTPVEGMTEDKLMSGVDEEEQEDEEKEEEKEEDNLLTPTSLSQLCVEAIQDQPQVFSLTSANGVRRRQDLGQNGIEDMIQLSDLNEASLLWNLKIRYDRELIYTYVGSILIAVNPYKMYDMYGLDVVKKYEGQILGSLPPHLFAIGSAAYSALPRSSQVVVISGESGSGKTESTKLVMQYLAAVNKSPSNLITEQILEASPLLESFGNAKTVRNDNSSRFGKFLEVHFKDGVILGAKVTEYLLEKSRIVTQAPEERNYHVFYELLAGLSEENALKYGLLSADKYFYLNQGGNCEIDGKYDGEDFQSLLSAMQVLGFTSEEQDTIFRILASVLHLGNVYFHRKQLKHGQEGVEIGSDAEIRWTGHLLQLSVDGIKQALTTKTTEARNERLLTALSIDQALDARDAFAKALYSSLFAWLVARINHIVYKGTKKTTAISILDIFGFEDFKENSFEQLCINYANENLQFYFNKHIFKLEQQEYAKEKIVWQNITYSDNMPVIHLLSKKPVGILHLLDDESNFPRATDLSFLEKCHYNHALNELYSRPRLNGPEFGIRHYAGPVWYNVEGFLDKNRDTLRPDVVELLISSSLPMLSKMFVSVRSSQEASKTLNKSNGRFITMKPRTPTVAARFHDSLQQLLESMSKCNPWFVRCIKPNNDKAAMKFDMPIVLEQLRYSGMLETIRIRKVGYPIRIRFQEFAERYRYLLPTRVVPPRGTPSRELCNLILDRHSGEYQLGTSKVFLRENLERTLERERIAILRRAAVILQKWTRGFLARKHYSSSKRSAIKLQSAYRGWRERKKYTTLRKGIVKAQAHFRGKRQRKRYTQLKEEMKRRAEMARERAKVKAQKEEQEKANRTIAVAGVNHLDIPAELAFMFNKLEEWQPVHNERQLVKVVGPVVEKPNQTSLPSDIDQHAFSKFTNIYFKSHVWGMKREPIKTPFLNKAKDSDFADSLALFKLILRFMNDETLTGKKEQLLGDYIAYKGLSNEKLRDEILCQLVNQTWRNDIATNCERGWLLMANCLSVFPPSSYLYKFLLKYVSDHGYDGYKAVCQQKLLASHNQWLRSFPPNLLEWRANRKRVNMALQLNFADGETVTSKVDSWTKCESLCASVLSERGVAECHGWTISLEDQGERNGLDYVMDAISELELPPMFPVAQQQTPLICTSTKIMPESQPQPARRPTVPPPQPPPPQPPVVQKVRSVSREHTPAYTGLSRQSALNDRYFDKPNRSRSLDNLLSPASVSGSVPSKLDTLGLSHSRLNERYHSMERIQESDNVGELTKAEEDNLESVSQRGENRKYSLTGASSDVLVSHSQLEFDFPELSTRSEDDKGSYIRGHPRFIKSQYTGKRAAPGSHSSRAHIETRQSDKSESGAKSSALSDTSEAPSLASHVRRVRVPSQASDVDQFLDDLFSPVLDQLSDARSLAASIKGGSNTTNDFEAHIFNSLFTDECIESSMLAGTIKGGGQGIGGVNAQEPTSANQQAPMFSLAPMVGSPPPVIPPMMSTAPLLMPLYNTSGTGASSYTGSLSLDPNASITSMTSGFMPVPIYNMQGLSLPGSPQPQQNGSSDPNIMAYQANLHRAFLQSAMAQNFQIQQQLLAQNQALQQMLQQQAQPVPDSPPQWSGSPPKAKSSPLTTTKAQVHRSGSPGSPHSAFTNVLSELKSRKSSVDSMTKSVIPPPPPMPPPPDLSDPNETRPFMDPYGRAKTVRIGKWRWPPPKDDNTADTSFLQFKMKQRRKHSQDLNETDGVEWEEFEIPEQSMPQHNSHHNSHHSSHQNSHASPSPGKQNHVNHNNHNHHQGSPNHHSHNHHSPPNNQQSAQSPDIHRSSFKSLEVGAARPSPGSVGKLRISNEMKSKLEKVTANHSLRSTTKTNNHPPPIPNMNPPTGKLDSDRRLLLQQQLAGRWGSVDSVDARVVTKEERTEVQQTNIVRSQLQVDRMEKTSPSPGWRPPPPPVTPHQMTPPSRSSSFYSHSNPPPPAPIQPVTRDLFGDGMFGGSMSTNHSDHVELEESSEFLAPVEPLPAVTGPPEAILSTKIHPNSSAAHFTYNRVSWKLNVRKEVFSPKETVSSPLVLHLVFCQVVADVLNKQTPRINKDERTEMIQLLERFHVTAANMHSTQHKASTKRAVVDMARHWLTYFSRMFPVNGGNHYPDVEMIAVGHLGLRLVRHESNQLRVIHSIGLNEIADVGVSKGGGSLQLVLSSGERLPLYTNKARQIQSMLSSFTRESIGTANTTINRDLHQARIEERTRPVDHKGWQPDMRLIMPANTPQHPQPVVSDDGKHSLLQFAINHFRQSPEKFEMLKTPDGQINGSLKLVQNHKKGDDWTWKEQVDLVKYSKLPIKESLLKLDSELNQLAIECFECAMRYMGDLPTTPDLTEVKCVYTILKHCHKHEQLRDEVYCQLMKQTTSNKNESCQRGWRLLSIVAAYFTCSDTLKPFLLKYLETAAYDKRRAFHGTANVCLQNLRKTLRYGGRKNVPSVEEVTAVSAGRNSKRQMYRLPGGSETVINTKSTTVVNDVIQEMCELINVHDAIEMEEFTLYCIVEGDAFTMPLAREEYILDVTTQLHKNNQIFYLIFCRSVWHFPLRLDSQLYIQVLFNQIAPDYLEGLLLVLPNEQLTQEAVYEVAKLAALLHRAADMTHPPAMKETKFLLPKPALAERDIKPTQWVQLVQSNWPAVQSLHSIDAKAQLLELLSKWPLFGSSFFAVKRGGDQQILALNRTGVHFLHLLTHETLSSVPFPEVISTRKVRAESGTMYLELKCGNLFQQRVARLQTDQAHEIARLIRQYMSLHRQQMQGGPR